MRDAITKILNRGEATAKAIAKAAGIELGDVLKVLNAMHRDAEVEREKRNGNEYVYWLATPSKPSARADMGNPITATAAEPGDSEGGEADLRRQIAELEATAAKTAIGWGQAKDDCDRLRNQAAEVEGVAADQRAKIAELEAEAHRLANRASRAAQERDQARQSETAKHERMLQACAEADRLRTERDEASHAIDILRASEELLSNKLAAALIDRDALREQLDSIPTVEAHTAGYLVRAPKRKPAIVTKAESAVARAMAAARNGSGRADVYALVLTGTARRGAEWRPAQ